jgi:transcriptional regulator with XRE-family HTH domain
MNTITDAIQAANLDIANRISIAMNRRQVNSAKLAVLAKLSKGRISQILSGNENLKIETVVKILHSLKCRIDFFLSKECMDEFEVKRFLEQCEDHLWNRAIGDLWDTGEKLESHANIPPSIKGGGTAAISSIEENRKVYPEAA